MKTLRLFLLAASALAMTAPALALSSGFAVVDSNGTLVRGSGAQGAVRNSTGTYTVVFAHTVKNCVFTATTGLTGSVGDPPNGFVTIAGANGNIKGVYVATFDASGAPADLAFHLNVRC
jgi:hypothetical protein